jgi:hypothetical protein
LFFDYTTRTALRGKQKLVQKGKFIIGRLSSLKTMMQKLKVRYGFTVIVITRTKKEEMSMNRFVMTALFALFCTSAQADRLRPDVDVTLPPEVFSSGGQRAQPCNQCCIYQDQNYSEGAVVKADGILLQCQRDERTISTNPLVWRRVKG